MSSLRIVILICVAWTVLGAADAHLDFATLEHRVMAATGGSICQFDIAPRWDGAHSITWKSQGVHSNDYSNLDGFPDDGDTAYGRFLDFVFGSDGRWQGGLHNVWCTPCPWIAPNGAAALTANYGDLDWSKLEFKWFEPDFHFQDGQFWRMAADRDGQDFSAYGHTSDMLWKGVQRLHAQNQRMVFWIDLHYSWPMQVWQDSDTAHYIPESAWDEAAMYHVVFARYLVSRYGIPVQAISFMNEPNVSGKERSKWTMEQLARFPLTLRAKLDQAGLTGVKCIPSTPNRINNHLPKIVDQLEAHADWAAVSDYVSAISGGWPASCLQRLAGIRGGSTYR